MVFSSIYFTFLFLPPVVLLYYLTKGRVRNLILLAASLVFYAYGEPRFVFVLMGSVLINYCLALGIAKSRAGKDEKKAPGRPYLILALILNIGLLFVYKYLFFTLKLLHLTGVFSFAEKITLPIGISFFTFQALSYVIDVYRGEDVQKDPLQLALYICFFPQLIAGPIIRYQAIAGQLTEKKRLGIGLFSAIGDEDGLFGSGVERFLLGFAKKVLLANQLAIVADAVFDAQSPDGVTAGMAWLGAICYTLQIYYDFSGYSDMAIGLSALFGFRFAENFNAPYRAKSITDFWRRWHMSLSGWFRDYVYIPLGGNRKGGGRQILNLFIVWFLTGLWHGANLTFVCWGLLYFVLLLMEKFLIRPDAFKRMFAKGIYRVFTLACVNFLWVLFRAKDLGTGASFLGKMLGILHPSVKGAAESGAFFAKTFREQGLFLLAAVLFCLPLKEWTKKLRIPEKITDLVCPLLLMGLFGWSVSYLLLGAHNPFLYFNF